MSNTITYLLLLLIAFVIGLVWYRIRPNRRMSLVSCGPMIERLQHEMSLVTTRVPISDVVDARMRGRWGSSRVSLLVKGDVEIGVDCKSARVSRVNSEERSFVVYLPMPSARRPRLDHERLIIHSIQRSWFAPQAEEVVAFAMKEAQGVIEDAANDEDLIDDARVRASLQVTRFFREIGCTANVLFE